MEGEFSEFREPEASGGGGGQFLDPKCHLCLADTMLESSSLQKRLLVRIITNIFITAFSAFSEKHLGKT